MRQQSAAADSSADHNPNRYFLSGYPSIDASHWADWLPLRRANEAWMIGRRDDIARRCAGAAPDGTITSADTAIDLPFGAVDT